jgi:serine/alanine adding enzyme
VRVKIFGEEDRERWNKYIMESGDSACYHLIGWKNVIEKTFGHKTYYLLAIEDSRETNAICKISPVNSTNSMNSSNSIDSINPSNSSNPSNPSHPSDRIVGILPLVHLRSILFGNFMVSLPYFNFGGICTDDAEVLEILLNEAIRIANKENVEHIEFRHTINVSDRLPVKTAKVSMQLRLPEDPEELWNSFSSNLRRKIRKPTKEGIYAKFGREDELESFYTVFSTKMRDLGTPVYSKRFFQNILKEFPESTWICTVYNKEEQAIASGFLIGFKERLEIPWVSSLKDYDHYYTNLLLYWSSLKFACEQGYRIFDFGRSTPGEGTYKFKEQWGASAVQLYWHYWLRNNGPLPELNPNNPKYQLAIRIWKRLPVPLTRLVGPMIVKNLP